MCRERHRDLTESVRTARRTGLHQALLFLPSDAGRLFRPSVCLDIGKTNRPYNPRCPPSSTRRRRPLDAEAQERRYLAEAMPIERLLRRTLAHPLEKRIYRVKLEVRSDNTRAIRLYKWVGFRREGLGVGAKGRSSGRCRGIFGFLRQRLRPMSTPVEDVAVQALSLPPEDRAKLVERLLASFEPMSPTQSAWLALAKDRRDAVRAGQVHMVPGGEALARVRARLT